MTRIVHEMKAKGRMAGEKSWGGQREEKETNGKLPVRKAEKGSSTGRNHACLLRPYWLCFLCETPRGRGSAKLKALLYSAIGSGAQYERVAEPRCQPLSPAWSGWKQRRAKGCCNPAGHAAPPRKRFQLLHCWTDWEHYLTGTPNMYASGC